MNEGLIVVAEEKLSLSPPAEEWESLEPVRLDERHTASHSDAFPS